MHDNNFLDGCCSTVQGLLDWFEADLGGTKLPLFRLICVLYVFSLFSLSSCSSLALFGRLALPRPRGGSASALNLVSLICPCGAHATHFAVL